jgi:hypothetical protein
VLNYKRIHNFNVLAVVETRVSGLIADRVIGKLKFENSVRVEAVGRSGGIWLLWNGSKVDLKVLKTARHLIHVVFDEGGSCPWLCSFVYANPNDQLKRACFEDIKDLASTISLPWMIVGDFNEIMGAPEKRGGAPIDMRRCLRFNKWVQECGLNYLGSLGPKFTWRVAENRGYGRVFERLDRGFSNQSFRIQFPELSIRVLPRVKSDHHPLLADFMTKCDNGQKLVRPFRFEVAWTTHDSFADLLKTGWRSSSNFITALDNLTLKLKDWNWEVFGSIFQRKKRVLARLGGVQKHLNGGHNSFLINL